MVCAEVGYTQTVCAEGVIHRRFVLKWVIHRQCVLKGYIQTVCAEGGIHRRCVLKGVYTDGLC